MCFALSKYKVLLLDWQSPVSALALESTQLEHVGSFSHLGRCVFANGMLGKKVSLRSVKAQ